MHSISAGGGHYLGGFDSRQGSVQRRIRQYAALSNPDCLELARKSVTCRGQGQCKFLMREQRGMAEGSQVLKRAIAQTKTILRQIPRSQSSAFLLGLEGNLAAFLRRYPCYCHKDFPQNYIFRVTTAAHKDRFNALLSFSYALLKDVMQS